MSYPVSASQAERRLIAAVMLRACLDAHKGDLEAQGWIMSDTATIFAEWLNINCWPPRLDQLGTHDDLSSRAHKLDVKPTRSESGRLDFLSRSTHTSDSERNRAGKVLEAPGRP